MDEIENLNILKEKIINFVEKLNSKEDLYFIISILENIKKGSLNNMNNLMDAETIEEISENDEIEEFNYVIKKSSHLPKWGEETKEAIDVILKTLARINNRSSGSK